jgi:hypothetical protein
MRNWMLGAAVVAGVMGLGAGTAQAAEFGVYVHGPAVYMPPCPGPGYEWVAGYHARGYWVPGRWAATEHRERLERERMDRERMARREHERDRAIARHEDRLRDRRGW